jgi:hypothetical protein
MEKLEDCEQQGRGYTDAFQIDAQARKVRLIEVGEIKDFGRRTSVADQLDFYSWDMDVYWIEPKSGTIFLIDGSFLASVQFFLDHCERITAKTALAHLRQNANIVGRAIPTKTVRPRNKIKKFGKSVAHKPKCFCGARLCVLQRRSKLGDCEWWAHLDLNQEPADYESDALTS